MKSEIAEDSMAHGGRLLHPRHVEIPDQVMEAIDGIEMWESQTLFAKPMSGGLNNENWYVRDGSDTAYFLKVPGSGTGFIDRSAGDAGTLRASDLGIGPAVYAFDPDSGVEITQFLEGYDTCTTTSLRTAEQGLQAMQIYRRLHGSATFDHTNTLFDQIDQHLQQMRELRIAVPSWVVDLVDEYKDVKRRFIASGLHIVPCHNDPMPGNFLVKQGTMKIIDFEFCGNNEESCELGLFLTEMFYDEEDAMPLLEEYFGTVSKQALSRVQASRVIGDIKWGMWGIITSVVRDARFDYWKYGIWKLMRAYTYLHELSWTEVKDGI
ncbi:MAG: phosphotransferase [Bifidobacterium sp.]|uniref:Phosphotransferase n=1 Tax=Bifidobacterium fermentum TaxID=3059035 RepID=A0AB39UBL9_9BIFI